MAAVFNEPTPIRRRRAWADIQKDYHSPQHIVLAGPNDKTVMVKANSGVEEERVCNVVSSHVDGEEGMHAVALDIDMPCELVPSKTPGHFHLYIEKKMPWHQYVSLLTALADAGIIEAGYLWASVRDKATFLRVPDQYYDTCMLEALEETMAIANELMGE
jgi:hypothetical protein